MPKATAITPTPLPQASARAQAKHKGTRSTEETAWWPGRPSHQAMRNGKAPTAMADGSQSQLWHKGLARRAKSSAARRAEPLGRIHGSQHG